MLDLTLIAPPLIEPIPIADAKSHLRVTHSAEDALITALVVAGRQWAEEFCSRALITQTWELRLNTWPCLIHLPRPTLLSVVDVTYVDLAGVTATLNSTAYTLRTGVEPGAVLFDLTQIPSVALAYMAGVRIRYTAGYGPAADAVPEMIKRAILLTVGHWYAHREAVNIGNITSVVPMAAEMMLTPYRVYPHGDWL